MENLSTLNVLEGLVKDHKTKSLQLLIGESSKKFTASNCDIILKMIEGLKEYEKEQSRLDWKAGYIASCFEVQEFFGTKKPHLQDSDLQQIEESSFEYIQSKFK